MATVDKNFRIKHGLVVQGSSATVNGNQVLTEASTLADLSGIDLSGLADGKVLIYNSSTSTWTIGDSGSSIAISETAPASPSAGDTWFDSSTGKTYIYYVDANSSQWIEMSNLGDNNLISKLADVDLSSLSDGHVLVYNSTSEKWISATLNTDAVAEGVSNLYFTEARALSAVQSSYEAYADQAEADAISTAAADATNKASTAESNANAYTASVAATIAPGDASTLTSAQAYTDSSISSISLDDISDVNTAGVADGDSLVYDVATSSWIPGEGSGSSASITVSETPPSSPEAGNLWLDSVTGNTYIYYSDYDNDQWVQTAGPNITPNRGAALLVSSTAPASPVSGDLWYDPSEGYTYLYYVDEDSSQWVQFGLNRNGADGAAGADGADGTDGADGVGIPVGGTEGQALVKSSATDYAVEWSDVSAGAEPAKTITSDSIALDFSDNIQLEQRAVAGDVTFTASNYTSGVKKTIYLQGDTVQRSLTFPAAWNFITDKPTAIGASRKNILDLNSFGTSESTTVALWLGANAFEPISASGGVETEIVVDGVTYKVHTFSSVGPSNFSVSDIGSISEVEYLIVAGGGGGGSWGGGGAGGGLLTNLGNPLQIGEIVYPITVGAGGAGAPADNSSVGSDGLNSTAFNEIALGGGGGGGSSNAGRPGGSGGGGGANSGAAGLGTAGQGNDGGAGIAGTYHRGGGGGGAGTAGQVATTINKCGNGGDGLASTISGPSVIYAGGGGGGGVTSSYASFIAGGDGGLGGGGAGGDSGTSNSTQLPGNPGTNGLGGGGGAAAYQNSPANNPGGNGGSGIVIVRYPITDPN